MAVVVATVTGSAQTRPPVWLEQVGTGEQGLSVSMPAVVDASSVPVPGGRGWSVMVAVTVIGKGAGAQRQYFRVPVLEGAGGVLTAMSGVAQVAAPSYGAQERTDYPVRVGPGPARDAVTGFLVALLTGTGEVSRYTAPGAPIAPIVPAPYRQVQVIDVASTTAVDGAAAATQARVLVSAAGRAGEVEIPLAYAMTVTLRSGRWEISQLDATPATRAPSTPDVGASGPSAPSPAPRTSK